MSATVMIVGLGAISCGYDKIAADHQIHTHLRAFGSHPRFRIVAGVDPDESQRAVFARLSGASVHAGLQEALREQQPDVVVVASPTATHAGVVDGLLAACKPRAILCEKPLAPTIEAARALVRRCAEAGVPLFVNYFRHSLPGVAEVRRRLESGRIAAGGKAVAWYSKGLLHNGSHFLELLQSWLGPLTSLEPLGSVRATAAGEEMDCRASFANGTAILLCAWEEAYSHFALELVTRSGRLFFGTHGEMGWQPVVPEHGLQGYHRLQAEPESIDAGWSRAQWHVADALARHLDGQHAELCGGAEALHVMELIAAALAVAKSRQA